VEEAGLLGKTEEADVTDQKKTASKRSNPKKEESAGKSVTEFMNQLDHPLLAEIEAVRQIILGVSDQIEEEIKWNAPSFYVGEHFATFNLHAKGYVQLIFHRGAKAKDDLPGRMEIEDPAGLLEWISKDRCTVKFHNLSEVNSSRAALEGIVEQWIKKMQIRPGRVPG
jgi:hypothetical protein